MLEYALYNVRAAGCRTIFVICGHRFEQVLTYVRASPFSSDVISIDANAEETVEFLVQDFQGLGKTRLLSSFPD